MKKKTNINAIILNKVKCCRNQKWHRSHNTLNSYLFLIPSRVVHPPLLLSFSLFVMLLCDSAFFFYLLLSFALTHIDILFFFLPSCFNSSSVRASCGLMTVERLSCQTALLTAYLKRCCINKVIIIVIRATTKKLCLSCSVIAPSSAQSRANPPRRQIKH